MTHCALTCAAAHAERGRRAVEVRRWCWACWQRRRRPRRPRRGGTRTRRSTPSASSCSTATKSGPTALCRSAGSPAVNVFSRIHRPRVTLSASAPVLSCLFRRTKATGSARACLCAAAGVQRPMRCQSRGRDRGGPRRARRTRGGVSAASMRCRSSACCRRARRWCPHPRAIGRRTPAPRRRAARSGTRRGPPAACPLPWPHARDMVVSRCCHAMSRASAPGSRVCQPVS